MINGAWGSAAKVPNNYKISDFDDCKSVSSSIQGPEMGKPTELPEYTQVVGPLLKAKLWALKPLKYDLPAHRISITESNWSNVSALFMTAHTLLRRGEGSSAHYYFGGKDGVMAVVPRPSSYGAPPKAHIATKKLYNPEGDVDWITAADMLGDLAVIGTRSGALHWYHASVESWCNVHSFPGQNSGIDKNRYRINSLRTMQSSEQQTLLGVQRNDRLSFYHIPDALLDSAIQTLTLKNLFKNSPPTLLGNIDTDACGSDFLPIEAHRLASIENGNVVLRKLKTDSIGVTSKTAAQIPNPDLPRDKADKALYKQIQGSWKKKVKEYETHGNKFAQHITSSPAQLVFSTNAGSIGAIDTSRWSLVRQVINLSVVVFRDYASFNFAEGSRPMRGCYDCTEVFPQVYLVGVEAGGPPLVDMRAGKVVRRLDSIPNRVSVVKSYDNGDSVVLHSASRRLKPNDKTQGTLYIGSLRMTELEESNNIIIN